MIPKRVYTCGTMHDMSDNDRREVLAEVIMDELKVIREYLEYLAPLRQDVTTLKEEVKELRIDRDWIKRMLAKHDTQLDDHEGRLRRLEATH